MTAINISDEQTSNRRALDDNEAAAKLEQKAEEELDQRDAWTRSQYRVVSQDAY